MLEATGVTDELCRENELIVHVSSHQPTLEDGPKRRCSVGQSIRIFFWRRYTRCETESTAIACSSGIDSVSEPPRRGWGERQPVVSLLWFGQ